MDVKISLATLIAWSCIILLSVTVPVHGGNTKKRLNALEKQYEAMNKKIDEILQQNLDVSSLEEQVEANAGSLESLDATMNKNVNTLKSDLEKKVAETMAYTDRKVSTLNEAISDDMLSLQQKIAKYQNNSVSTTDVNNLLQEKKVAFSVRVRHGESATLEPDETLIFTDALINQGGAYSTSTGVFTAPANGTYAFFVHILSSNRVLEMKMVKNDKTVMLLYVHGSNYGADSNTAILSLTKGDTVNVAKHGPWGKVPFYVHHMFSTFSGFMLYAN